MMAKKKAKFFDFHFRKYKFFEGGKKKRAKHPKLIVDEDDTTYGFMGLTESAKRGRHKNIPLSDNPKRGDSRPAYIRDEYRRDRKDHFGERLKDYKLSLRDADVVSEHLNRRRKK